MCGFTGFLSKSNSLSRNQAHQLGLNMNETLSHRGPDAGDVWQDPDVLCTLGHRRLSIIDLSKDGAQPMISANGRYAIAYNGEVYNFQTLRQDLESAGLKFRGRSDTEVILASIQHWGLNQAIQKFSGMFAFALWDLKDKTLHLARDPMGKKPLYIGWAGSDLIFGSELKALRAHPDFKATLCHDALNLYMQYSYIPAPHCIYQNVWQLPPGHRLSIEYKTLGQSSDLVQQMECHWNAQDIAEQRYAQKQDISLANATQEFEDILKKCVNDRMVSDVPLGAFLSGGIDSSAITALMQSQSTQAIKTYSIGFEEAGYNEAGYARLVANHLSTDHHELILNAKDTINVIPSLSRIYDEPFADASAIPTYLVSEFARKSVTVALSGDGGDEMLGGYNRHIQGPKIYNITQNVPNSLRGVLSKAASCLSVNTWNKTLPFIPQAGTKMHKMAASLQFRTQKELYESFICTFDKLNIMRSHEEIQQSFPELNFSNFSNHMMLWDTLSYLPHDVLTKVDRASMATSLECRSPLLDKRIFSYCWRLPDHLKIQNNQGKVLLRKMLENYIPAKLFERPKQGFSLPIDDWLRHDLKDWADALLDPQILENDGIFDKNEVSKLYQDHLKGKGNNAQRLWTILMFQGWKEKWL